MKLFLQPYLTVKQFKNSLYCNINDSISDEILVLSYQLFRGRSVYKKFPSNSLEYQIPIDKNDCFKVRILYKNKQGEINWYDTKEEYLFNMEVANSKYLSTLINVQLFRNKVLVNLKLIKDKFYKIKQYQLVKETTVISTIASNALEFCPNILESGQYKILVSAVDFNGNDFIMHVDFYFEYTKLSSAEIINPNALVKSSVFLFNILYAFILREFQRKYDKGYLRYFSIVLGPAVQLIILVAIFTLMGRKSVAGLGIPLFVLTGILPYTFFTSAGNCLTIVSGNRSLLSYRQVKIIDIILSSILMELLVNVIVFVGGVFICWYFGITIKIYNPLSLILAFLLLFIFTLGLSMILAVIGFYFAEFNYAIQVVFRALFYISGVFFSIENIPVQYQKYVLWNPLLQIIEFIRFSFVSFDLPHELSYLYLFKCTIVIFLIGISLYFVNRNKFMVNDRAR